MFQIHPSNFTFIITALFHYISFKHWTSLAPLIYWISPVLSIIDNSSLCIVHSAGSLNNQCFFNFPDPFERACDVVAAAIEGDWPTLYRQLPFHPARGSKTIDKDIAELSSMASRTSLQEICELSLKKWRRFHTRAKYEDLQVGDNEPMLV